MELEAQKIIPKNVSVFPNQFLVIGVGIVGNAAGNSVYVERNMMQKLLNIQKKFKNKTKK